MSQYQGLRRQWQEHRWGIIHGRNGGGFIYSYPPAKMAYPLKRRDGILGEVLSLRPLLLTGQMCRHGVENGRCATRREDIWSTLAGVGRISKLLRAKLPRLDLKTIRLGDPANDMYQCLPIESRGHHL